MCKYFDLTKDDETLKAGGFFCQACLIGKSAGEQSVDKRYCKGCYDFLTKEHEILKSNGTTKRPAWVPVDDSKVIKPIVTGVKGVATGKKAVTQDRNLSSDIPADVTAIYKPCAVCGTKFTAIRSDAKYCSIGCRVKNHRRPDLQSPGGGEPGPGKHPGPVLCKTQVEKMVKNTFR